MFNHYGQFRPKENMATLPILHCLPETGYLRLWQIVGKPADPKKGTPAVAGVFPVSRSTWWNGCRTGRYPAPVQLSERVTAWRVEAIRSLIERTAGNAIDEPNGNSPSQVQEHTPLQREPDARPRARRAQP